VKKKQEPAFNEDTGSPLAMFGAEKFLWGNMPALDILKMSQNEGVADFVHRDLDMLFAASGDIRNIVKTVTAIPDEYDASGRQSSTINILMLSAETSCFL
jgi:hypothetical protein